MKSGSSSLPPPLLTSEPGSFARRTIVERQPQILTRLMCENGYPPEIVADLQRLLEEILARPFEPLQECAPDTASWNDLVWSQAGRSWLNSSWYLAEAYFYRRLLEAVRYFQPGLWEGCDPFASQKRAQQERAVKGFQVLPARMMDTNSDAAFEVLVHSSLWGNRADLSNAAMRASPQTGLAARREQHNIIIDDTAQARSVLARGVSRVDFISDNVGMDVLADLALADFLLVQGWAKAVTMHLKDRPFFVSDAMISDLAELIGMLAQSPLSAHGEIAERIEHHLGANRLVLVDDPFWSGPLMLRDLPDHLSHVLAAADLVILKGDVNYRRLLDDRHWPFTTPIDVCAGYFPAQFLALRTLKGEILVGLPAGQAEAFEAADPEWLINGERGVVQMGGALSSCRTVREAGAAQVAVQARQLWE